MIGEVVVDDPMAPANNITRCAIRVDRAPLPLRRLQRDEFEELDTVNDIGPSTVIVLGPMVESRFVRDARAAGSSARTQSSPTRTGREP